MARAVDVATSSRRSAVRDWARGSGRWSRLVTPHAASGVPPGPRCIAGRCCWTGSPGRAARAGAARRPRLRSSRRSRKPPAPVSQRRVGHTTGADGASANSTPDHASRRRAARGPGNTRRGRGRRGEVRRPTVDELAPSGARPRTGRVGGRQRRCAGLGRCHLPGRRGAAGSGMAHSGLARRCGLCYIFINAPYTSPTRRRPYGRTRRKRDVQ